MSTSEGSEFDRLFRFLVAYRLLFYLGGLLAMSVPLGLAWGFDVQLPRTARTTIVAVSFAVIVGTYLAERRVGLDHVDPRTGTPNERYSMGLRMSVVLGIAGVAVGLYLALEGRLAMGVLFVVGAVLFFQLAYRHDSRADDAGGEPRG